MSRGFTLIELLVTISIFVIITTLAVFSNNQFNSSILLTNLGYEIALSIREAQVYGTTVKAPTSCVSGSQSCNFTSGYGVHFDLSNPTLAAGYVLFEDRETGTSLAHMYQSGEALTNFSIGKGYSIEKICVLSGNTYSSAQSADVSFVRPEPEAWVYSNVSSAQITELDIYIQDPLHSATRGIIVGPTGQISVTESSPNC